MNEEMLLQHLLRSGITPSFSFPLDVCEFRGEGTLSPFTPRVWPKMQQDLKKALSEFSPGRELTVDGDKYRVGGLYFYNPPDKVDRAKHVFKEMVNGVPKPTFENLDIDGKLIIKWYNRCTVPHCGWVSKELEERLELDECPVCGGEWNEANSGRWYRPDGFAPIIVPWDTRTDRQNLDQSWSPLMKPEIPKQKEEGEPTGGVKLPSPILENPTLPLIRLDNPPEGLDIDEKELLENLGKRLTIRKSDAKGQGIDLIIINSGYNGHGYATCTDCGRLELQKDNFTRINSSGGHHRPYAANPGKNDDTKEWKQRRIKSQKKCTGNYLATEEHDSLFLGMTFRTDMILLSFELKKPLNGRGKKTRNVAINDGIRAIKEALITEIQQVKQYINREIGGGIRKTKISRDGNEIIVFSIFLYDDVSGGAGLTTSLFDDVDGFKDFTKIIKNVESRLSGDLCIGGKGCERACVGCLLDFRNQREHDSLDRKNGLRLLRYLMNGTIPSVESGDPKKSDDELRKLAITLSNDMQFFADGYNICAEDLCIMVEYEGCKIRLRPISDMTISSKDPVLSQYYKRREKHKLLGIGPMLKPEHNTSPDDLSGDIEVLWLPLSDFYFNRQMIADTIHSLMSDDL